MQIDKNTPILMLTVGQLKQLWNNTNELTPKQKEEPPKRYVYGMAGIAKLFDCSLVTANRIKRSGKINAAIKQIGRKIVVDADLAIELADKTKYKP